MNEPRSKKKEVKYKAVRHISGTLKCQRCPQAWGVVDLNPERKVVPCPTCGELNDIREAIKRVA